jgi:List-Bact-rpt repeat protein
MVGGPFVHVVYAIPSDGADHSADFAQRINDDVDQITAWWTGQDATRAPRFDLTPFSCGSQVDLTLVRLPQAGSQLAPRPGRARSLTAGVMSAGLGSSFGKYLVYYDGPAEEPNLCGEGGGAEDAGPDYAFVYTGACTDVPTAAIAAHELLHALSALPQGAPNACPGDDGHPCDSEQDVLYPFASGDPLASLILDVGRDDYYGHSGNWFDLQDSIWLTHVGDQAPLSISVRGGGKVVSLEPSPDCAATCSVDWNRGTTVQLEGIPAAGKRLVRWSGGCTGSGDCTVTLSRPTSVSAFFAQSRFRLSVAVSGRGLVRSTPRGLACRTRCGASFTSYKAVRVTATPSKGWRFARWAGVCSGTRSTCSVPMTKAVSARAVFARSS